MPLGRPSRVVEALFRGGPLCRPHRADAGRTERRTQAFTIVRIGCLAAMLLAGLALASEATPPAAQAPGALPEGEGKVVVARACNQCHSLQVATSLRLTRKQWEAKIDQMLARGAKLSDEEIDLAAEYLARNFGRPQ